MEVKTFDLIYVSSNGERTMSCGIIDPANPEDAMLVGPFPAKEAGPKIVDAILRAGISQTKKDAEAAYMFEHFKNMSSGQNKAGQAYPFRC